MSGGDGVAIVIGVYKSLLGYSTISTQKTLKDNNILRHAELLWNVYSNPPISTGNNIGNIPGIRSELSYSDMALDP